MSAPWRSMSRSAGEPLQVLKDENERLIAGAADRPFDYRRQLPATKPYGPPTSTLAIFIRRRASL
jgi:hypothetical protein